MKKLFLLTLCLLTTTILLQAQPGNGKKVYADFHGPRFTRQHDGKVGVWQQYWLTPKSKTGIKSVCYNPDIILENGQHDVAAVHYPLVGMQSNMDPDYIEYQILSAKAANIDGFFVEWGYMEHENDELLKAIQEVAKKYDFEVGVNWCDGWLYKDWITSVYPEMNNRQKKTEHFVKCYQYLMDNVFTGSTAPRVTKDQVPVFYLFATGARLEEYEWVKTQLPDVQDKNRPRVLRRWVEWDNDFKENNKN